MFWCHTICPAKNRITGLSFVASHCMSHALTVFYIEPIGFVNSVTVVLFPIHITEIPEHCKLLSFSP